MHCTAWHGMRGRVRACATVCACVHACDTVAHQQQHLALALVNYIHVYALCSNWLLCSLHGAVCTCHWHPMSQCHCVGGTGCRWATLHQRSSGLAPPPHRSARPARGQLLLSLVGTLPAASAVLLRVRATGVHTHIRRSGCRAVRHDSVPQWPVFNRVAVVHVAVATAAVCLV